jgi:hypothetical protein
VLVLAAILIGVSFLMHNSFGYGVGRFDFDGPRMMGGRGFHGSGMFPMMGGMLFLMGFRWLLPLLLVGLEPLRQLRQEAFLRRIQNV